MLQRLRGAIGRGKMSNLEGSDEIHLGMETKIVPREEREHGK